MKQSVKNALVFGGSALVGGISGFFGGGGGMLCVPLLDLSGLETKEAHATALLVMLPVCILCTAIYAFNGYFEPNALLCAMIGVSFGGAAGAALLDRLSGNAVALVFALVMIGIGVKLTVA